MLFTVIFNNKERCTLIIEQVDPVCIVEEKRIGTPVGSVYRLHASLAAATATSV